MYETSKLFKFYLHWMDLIWEHSYPGMSFKALHLYSKMVLKSLFSIVLDLKIPKDIFMHLTRSRVQEQSNPRFPTIGIKTLVSEP